VSTPHLISGFLERALQVSRGVRQRYDFVRLHGHQSVGGLKLQARKRGTSVHNERSTAWPIAEPARTPPPER
jgi:hypothetical protein